MKIACLSCLYVHLYAMHTYTTFNVSLNDKYIKRRETCRVCPGPFSCFSGFCALVGVLRGALSEYKDENVKLGWLESAQGLKKRIHSLSQSTFIIFSWFTTQLTTKCLLITHMTKQQWFSQESASSVSTVLKSPIKVNETGNVSWEQVPNVISNQHPFCLYLFRQQFWNKMAGLNLKSFFTFYLYIIAQRTNIT